METVKTTDRDDLQEQQRREALTTRTCPICFTTLVRCCNHYGCQRCSYSTAEHEESES